MRFCPSAVLLQVALIPVKGMSAVSGVTSSTNFVAWTYLVATSESRKRGEPASLHFRLFVTA